LVQNLLDRDKHKMGAHIDTISSLQSKENIQINGFGFI